MLSLTVACSSNASDRDLNPPEPPYDMNVYEEGLDYAQVEFVLVTASSGGTWRFEVRIRHNDQGWSHYADLWEVVAPETGDVLGTRVLAHPHDNEQPFTRSQSGISIPQNLTEVIVRAKCNVHGYGGKSILVDLTKESGDSFEVR